ncbi:MAG: hypothetical protein CFH34_00912 [Alphaproteobacteria bacterium MarineAlpha9_Bin4]|nr:hypothetical protein [Pelagibacterales bacterium]PPR26522.1 MAG: hypothetical protein CFH34_00912 [Alphaproteobacteria bacterium MarineAlpha9_Bin4]|tara:strand:+ start:3936 stop:4430 length:495 start_codon:yes stop_codon:yes gene_type:complete
MRNFLIIIFVSLLSFYSLAQETKEYKFNWYPSIEVEDNIINFPDSSRYETYDTKGVWEDNFGNYGIMRCIVSQFINKRQQISLDAYCEAEDFEKEKFWTALKRNSFNKAGIGKNKYLHTEKKYKILEEKECPYAAQIIDGGGVFKLLCKITIDEYNILKKYSNQ